MPAPVLDAAAQLLDEALDARLLRHADRLVEQDHQWYDLDPDSECCLPGLTCVNCPPREGGDRP